MEHLRVFPEVSTIDQDHPTPILSLDDALGRFAFFSVDQFVPGLAFAILAPHHKPFVMDVLGRSHAIFWSCGPRKGSANSGNSAVVLLRFSAFYAIQAAYQTVIALVRQLAGSAGILKKMAKYEAKSKFDD